MSYSWETESAAPGPSAGSLADTSELARRVRALAARIPRPELIVVMALAGALNLWALSRNGWANEFYAAAVKSMGESWHDFLFASLDKGGVMTVDKPPLALWVQALSVRVFGFHSLSILVPQALMGVASVALTYDLVRRRFERLGGFVAGLALALTPITVAISRHNNPDALLVLCCVAALWCTVRAFERAPAGRGMRWLAAAGVCVGLGFETKMLVALVVVPGIAAAWLWVSPAGRGRLHALGQLLAGATAILLVGGAWPALVELTPAADRPWVSGTSNNTIFSLIFEYNGLGRVDGQAGGPGGTASNTFGGATGPLRLLNSALGGQAGWLLGFALVCGLAILVASRLRRSDGRSGWLMAVGGAFATTAVLFSFASGIFHPYYVSLLAPFAAALVGAGAAQLVSGGVNFRIVGPLAVLAGVVVELVVRANYPGQLTWLPPVLIVVGLLAAVALATASSRAVRLGATAGAVAALLLAPGVWAFDTLGHATSGTFPAGGPASAESGGPGGPGGFRGSGGPFAAPGEGGAVPQLFGSGSQGFGQRAGRGGGFPGAGTGSGPMGGGVPASVESYVKDHGGGTIAVASQSSAASAILAGDDDVAGIGGFSGRESEVSASWLAQAVRAGKIRWVLDDEGAGGAGFGGFAGAGLFSGEAGGFSGFFSRGGGGSAGEGPGFPGGGRGFPRAGAGGGGGLPGETRVGAKKAMAAVAQACQAVTLSSESSAGAEGSRAGATLYDCAGRAEALEAVGAQQSRT